MAFRAFLVLLVFIAGTADAWAGQAQLNVFAAVSLADSLKDIAVEFENRTGTHLNFNLAGSGTLRLQIEQGMPCDVFLSADTKSPAILVEKNLVESKNQKPFLSGHLVVVTSLNQQKAFQGLTDLLNLSEQDGLSLADPQTVPAGIYAREALTRAGVWESLRGRVIPALDVRAALAQVEAGNAAFGIVYRTDALTSRKVRVVYEIPDHLHSAIQYVACVLKDAENPSGAQAFYDFLSSEFSKKVFLKYGFDVL